MLNRTAYAALGITILEDDDGMVGLRVATERGPVTIVAEFVRDDDQLTIDRADVSGEGLNLGRIRQLAQLCGQVEDVSEVIVRGGRRSSGLHKGRIPTPIKVKVNR